MGQIDYSQFRRDSSPVPPSAPLINTPPPVNLPPEEYKGFRTPTESSTPWTIGGYNPRAIGAMALRGIGGLAPGGFIGAGVNALTEGGAQLIGGEDFSLPNIGGAAAIGAIPFSGAGKLLNVVGKSALLGGGSTALRQQTEKGLHIPNLEEGKEIALGATISGATGGIANKVLGKIDYSKFSKATPKEKAIKEVSEAVAQASETKIPAKAAEKAAEVVAEVSSKVPAEPKILLPKELAGAKPRYGYGTREFVPEFENDFDKALYIIARPKKSAQHDKYVKWLTDHTGLEEKELQEHGMKVREGLKSFLSGQTEDGKIKVPKLHTFDFGIPKIPTVDVPPTPTTPTVSTAADTQAPQVDLQTAAPEVKLGDFETKPELTQLQSWMKNPIRKAAAEARQLQTGLDLSFPFRQGITNITRKEFWKSMVPMMKSALKEENFETLQNQVLTKPNFKMAEEAGIEFSELGKNIKNVEESISKDTLVEGIKLAGFSPIRASNRAYMAFGNKLRSDLFDNMVEKAQKAGVELIGKDGKVNENARAIARYINDATGRGHLGKLEKNAEILNDVLFSPKLMASRVNMVRRAFADPRMLEKGVDSALAKQLRKRAWRDMAAVGGLLGGSATISELSGAEGTLDPRSTDFGKLKFGNTRLDMTGGFQQYARVATQLATGQVNTGDKVEDRNRKTTAERFGRNKLSPLAGLIVDWMAEKNVLGEKFTWSQAAKDRVIPLIIQDLTELAQEDPKLIPVILPGAFGIGIQSYGKTKSSSGKSGSGMFKNPNSGYKMPSIKMR